MGIHQTKDLENVRNVFESDTDGDVSDSNDEEPEQEYFCHICQVSGHETYQCTTCKICNKKGHMFLQCTEIINYQKSPTKTAEGDPDWSDKHDENDSEDEISLIRDIKRPREYGNLDKNLIDFEQLETTKDNEAKCLEEPTEASHAEYNKSQDGELILESQNENGNILGSSEMNSSIPSSQNQPQIASNKEETPSFQLDQRLDKSDCDEGIDKGNTGAKCDTSVEEGSVCFPSNSSLDGPKENKGQETVITNRKALLSQNNETVKKNMDQLNNSDNELHSNKDAEKVLEEKDYSKGTALNNSCDIIHSNETLRQHKNGNKDDVDQMNKTCDNNRNIQANDTEKTKIVIQSREQCTQNEKQEKEDESI